MFSVFICLGLLIFIELCIFLCCLVCYYFRQVIGWEDFIVIFFVSKGFPYKDQTEKLFITMVSFCVFPIRNILNFFINFIFFYTEYTFQMHDVVYLF